MLEQWTKPDAATAMPPGILTGLGPLVRKHPWWRARARFTRDLLQRCGIGPPAQVLDVGCGWGVTLDAQERAGFTPWGLDLDEASLLQLESENPERRLILADITDLPDPPPRRFAAVLALDVLEHLPDDALALRNLMKLLAPGGTLILSVPARPDLWSEFDAIQGHQRRYGPQRLRSLCDQAGLVPTALLWWGQWLVPLLRSSRKRTRARPELAPDQLYARYLELPPWPFSTLLRIPFALERPFARAGRLHTGTSLWLVARADQSAAEPIANPVSEIFLGKFQGASVACQAASGSP
jgi:SAM-dependent methyltransferase